MTTDLMTERALIGLALVVDGVVPLTNGLPPSAFSDGDLRSSWTAIVQLEGEGRPLDPVTVATTACAGDAQRRTCLMKLLAGCVDGQPRSLASVTEYASRLRKLAALRRLARVCAEVEVQARAGNVDPESLRRNLEESMHAESRSETKTFVSVADSIGDTLAGIEDLQARGGGLAGISTGFGTLDRVLSGISPGSLYVVGARPGVGKTAFALNIARHVARQRRGSVAFFSLEMPRGQLNQRLLADMASVPLGNIRDGRLTAGEWHAITEVALEVSQLALHVDDTGGLQVGAIRSRAKRLAAEGRLALIVLDYLQLAQPDRRRDSRAVEVGEISNALKAMAKELSVPVIALSQLNRQSESRDGGRPRLGDLRDSGAIEQDADAVMLLHRPERGMADDDPEKAQWIGKALLDVAKNRQGETREIPMYFSGQAQRFTEGVR